MKSKRGWIRILEATVAVLIVSGVMVTVYSEQIRVGDLAVAEYSFSLQNEILEDISINSEYRLNALRVRNDLPIDYDYSVLDEFVASKVPSSYGYLLRICDLGADDDYCKMDPKYFRETLDKDIYVEEAVISSEIGDGHSVEVYSPKKIKLFFWEGGFSENFCREECEEGHFPICSDDLLSVVEKECSFDTFTGCHYVGDIISDTSCDDGEICYDGLCTEGLDRRFVCGQKIIVDSGCVIDGVFDNECNAYSGGEVVGQCGYDITRDAYQCWDIETYDTECSENPSCVEGYELVRAKPCKV